MSGDRWGAMSYREVLERQISEIERERDVARASLLEQRERIFALTRELAAAQAVFDRELPSIDFGTEYLDAAIAAERKRLREHWEGNLKLAEDQADRRVAEATKPLVDALIKIANDPTCDRCQVAVDALTAHGAP